MSTDRYSRQTRFAPFGEQGHQQLAAARIAVVGLGGLGSTLAAHAVRAGARQVRLIDRDIVEESNLPRQGLFTLGDAQQGLPKAAAAAAHLAALGGATEIVTLAHDLSVKTIGDLIGDADLVLDGLDNFEGRYLLNDFCHRQQIAWIYGGAVGSTGAVLRVPAGGRPCLRCLFPATGAAVTADTCETVGVLSPFPALVASLQAAEMFRHFAEPDGETRLWHLDPWEGRAYVARQLPTSETCPCCRFGRYPALELGEDSTTTRLCGRGTVQVMASATRRLALDELAERWQGLGEVQRNPFLCRLVMGDLTLSVFPDGRALIQGVASEERARSLYARYVGA